MSFLFYVVGCVVVCVGVFFFVDMRGKGESESEEKECKKNRLVVVGGEVVDII